MKKLFLLMFVFLLFTAIAQAQDGSTAIDVSSNKGLAAIAAGIAVLGAGLGIGLIGYSGLQALARQPDSLEGIRSTLIVASALIEGVAFFALIICILVILI